MSSAAYHMAYGRHSLIPECCIRFFIEEWDAREMRRWDTPFVCATHASPALYVQCPPCLHAGRIARIRICVVECGRECYGDFK